MDELTSQCLLWICMLIMPTIRVLYFAKSREVAGVTEQEFNLQDGSTTVTLLEALIKAHPGLESVLKSCVLALNQEYVQQGEVHNLKDGDEVAVIPPLSGG